MARRPAIPFVLITVLIDMIGVGLMLPVLPVLVGEFTASRETQTYWYGALAASYGLMLFLCAPGLGALSDRYGRRPILLIGIAGLGTLFLVAALATSLWMLFAARMLAGATGATLAVANAYLADITPPEERAKQFGRIGAMFGVGFIIGPAVGGVLGAIDVRLPFYVAACLSLTNFAYGWFVLPESLPRERRQPFELARANPIASLTALARLRGVGLLVVVYGLINLAQFILHTNWVLYTNFRFDWGPRESGLSLFVVGLMAVLVQGVLLGHLVRRFGERNMALAGIGSSGAGLHRLGQRHAKLDDVRDHLCQPARLCRRAVGLAGAGVEGGRSDRARSHDGGAQFTGQPDGRHRADDRRASAGPSKPPAGRRLAYRGAVFRQRCTADVGLPAGGMAVRAVAAGGGRP